MANAVLEPVDLSLPLMKELGAKWLTEMPNYLSANPQFVVNGFIRFGITHALDHNDEGNVVESGITCDEIKKILTIRKILMMRKILMRMMTGMMKRNTQLIQLNLPGVWDIPMKLLYLNI